MDVFSYKPKVLYLDDEENNLVVFKSSFRRYYDVITAANPMEALRLLKDNPVDVIISDQRMPEMSGVEFLKIVPETPDNIRMILTGFSDIEMVIDALNMGKVHRYFKKPWQKEELKSSIDEAYETLLTRRKVLQAANENLSPNIENVTLPLASHWDVQTKSLIDKLENEVQSLSEQVVEAHKNVQLLSEIGQDITSTLNLETILNTVYENVNQLMDASVFGIGMYNPEAGTIDYKLAFDNGKRYQPYSRSMEDKDQFPVWCLENKKEVFINNVEIEYKHYISNIGKLNDENATLEDGSKSLVQYSLIYMPLMIKEKIIGLITVQSYSKNAYTTFHLSALRNIAIFVATALENSKAFHLIEKQKTEIEHKNADLEIEVEKRTEELALQKDELEETFSKLKVLTEIGREITSSLDLERILTTVYENVNELMDASVFGIGIYHPETKTIDIRLAIENGKRYQPYQRSMDDKNQFPVWCIENKREIYINNVEKEYSRYIRKYDRKIVVLEDGTQSSSPLSIIYMPLLFDNEPIGILTVQSFRKYSYTQYHLDLLRSLASYITTAIQNAHSYGKMTEAFQQLKSAQSKLVESEKMASLGVLTAGVAHEINNPVNFISAGIESLKENYTDIKKTLLNLKEVNKALTPEEQVAFMEKCLQLLEIETLLPEMEELIGSIKTGAERTTEIVKGLRNFTRLDETDMKKANVEEGINNTLAILNNKIKDRINIIRNFEPVPEIMCYPGQLNQVFLNIISNAADAISGKGNITISLKEQKGCIEVTIADDGSGMPSEVMEHIFEPFFTTKEVGNGTGLGLSISYGIIEKHKGSIKVESEPGKGTTFLISIPVSD